MSYIGNTPGVSSQRVVTEEVISGSPKSAFYPVGGYSLGYVDVLVNGLEVDTSDFTATDGVLVTLGTAAAVGDTVKIKCYLPRGLSDGYLKSEADARYPRVDTAAQGLDSTQQSNARTNINAVNKAGDTMTGNLTVPLWVELFTDGVSGTQRHGRISATSSANNPYAGGVKLEYYNFNGSAYQFYDGLVVDGSGNTTLAGNLVLSSGKGIDFSAGSNASGMTSEVLDDYETGTWTPVGITTYGTLNITSQSSAGFYTKIGNIVTASFTLVVSTYTGSGNIGVSGLPFTIMNSTTEAVSGPIQEVALSGNMGLCEMAYSASYINVLRRYDNSSMLHGNGSVIRGRVTYKV